MTVHTANPTDFAYDYASGKAAVAETATKTKGALSRAFDRYVARRQAAAMAQISMYDPRLARDIRAAQDRAEWK